MDPVVHHPFSFPLMKTFAVSLGQKEQPIGSLLILKNSWPCPPRLRHLVSGCTNKRMYMVYNTINICCKIWILSVKPVLFQSVIAHIVILTQSLKWWGGGGEGSMTLWLWTWEQTPKYWTSKQSSENIEYKHYEKYNEISSKENILQEQQF